MSEYLVIFATTIKLCRKTCDKIMPFYNSSFFGDASLSACWSICSKIFNLVPSRLDYDQLDRMTGAEYGEEDFAQAKGRYDEQLRYVYTSTGQKLRAVYYTAMPNVRVSMGMDYDGIEDNHLSVDSVDYLLGGTVLCRNGRVSQILFDGGYVKVERRVQVVLENFYWIWQTEILEMD